ncbi:MAG: exodeoxyribonuclease VII small subunit [Candidatus Margulisiibacteriota bacterium]
MTKKLPSFEDRLRKLEAIVEELEADTPLDQAMTRFDEGVKLATECQKELERVESQIMKIVNEKDGPIAVPIEEHEFPTLF